MAACAGPSPSRQCLAKLPPPLPPQRKTPRLYKGMKTISLANRMPLATGEISVDSENFVIKNISIIQAGEALGHGFQIDKVMLEQVRDAINAKPGSKGVKSRLTHPGMPDCGGWDGLEVMLGRVKNATLAGDKVRGDLHIGKFASVTPAGDLRTYIMAIAKEDPELLGVSIEFVPDEFVEIPRDENLPEDAPDPLPLGRVKDVTAADLVGDPAANRDGLLSRLPPTVREGIKLAAPDLFSQWFSALDATPATGSVRLKSQAQEGSDSIRLQPQTNLENEDRIMLTPAQKASLAQAVAVAVMTALSAGEQPAAAAAPAAAPAPTPAPAPAAQQLATETPEQLAARKETERRNGIKDIATLSGLDEKWVNLHTLKGTSIEDARKEALSHVEKANKAPAIVGLADSGVSNNVSLEAAICLAGKLPNVEKVYPAQVLEQASKSARSLSLQSILLDAAQDNGFTGRRFRGNEREILHYAMPDRRARLSGGVTTISLPGIFGNVANKFLLAGFMSVEQTWRQVCAIRNVTDFKTVTSYRLTGSMQYEKVGPDGQLKHAKFGESSFTNKADTYGVLNVITRQDQINDDLGALTTAQQRIGRGAGLKLNDVFWTEWLENAGNFWHTDNKNYISGTANALSIGGLKTAVSTFIKQVDSDGKPIAIAPEILLVPAELSVTADEIYTSTNLTDGTTSAKPSNNTFKSKYRPVTSAYLSNTSYTGYSTTAWWLLGNPANLAAIEVALLNGQESPTVESAEADFDILGIALRGYHDFGVKKQDPRAGVKSAGA